MEILALVAVAMFGFLLPYLIYKISTAKDKAGQREFKQPERVSSEISSLNKTEKKKLEAYIKRIKKG
jgi:hypothetical protein